MFTMTKAEALAIQARHVEHYCAAYPDKATLLRSAIRFRTTADALEDGVLYPVTTINEHVPRGGAIERMLGIDLGD